MWRTPRVITPNTNDKKGDIWAFEADGSGSYGGGSFLPAPIPMASRDVEGNIWATATRCSAQALLFVETPKVRRMCFGGGGKTLYITARTSVYTVRTNVQGIYPANRDR